MLKFFQKPLRVSLQPELLMVSRGPALVNSQFALSMRLSGSAFCSVLRILFVLVLVGWSFGTGANAQTSVRKVLREQKFYRFS